MKLISTQITKNSSNKIEKKYDYTCVQLFIVAKKIFFLLQMELQQATINYQGNNSAHGWKLHGKLKYVDSIHLHITISVYSVQNQPSNTRVTLIFTRLDFLVSSVPLCIKNGTHWLIKVSA